MFPQIAVLIFSLVNQKWAELDAVNKSSSCKYLKLCIEIKATPNCCSDSRDSNVLTCLSQSAFRESDNYDSVFASDIIVNFCYKLTTLPIVKYKDIFMFGKTELFKCMWGLGRFTLSDNNCLVVMIILMDTWVLAYFPEEWRMARLEEFLRFEDPVFKTWRSEDCIFCCILPQMSADDLKTAAYLNSEESKYVFMCCVPQVSWLF